MSLQPRTSAPGKARRAASAGKPKRAKKAVAFKEAAPKARHTTAQKAARKGASAKPANGKPSTRRYSDVDPTATSKKEVRLVERSKLRAKRYQEQTASKPRPIEAPEERKARIERSQRPDSRAKKFVKEREVRESAPRAERTERSERPTTRPEARKPYKKAERPAFKRDDSRPAFKKDSDTRPTNRRDAVKAKIARTDDGRPNFEPRKREKFDPTRPKKSSVAPDTRAANFRAERPVRDRRNDSPAYARDDAKKHGKSHSNAAVDFGADDNYISANLADANLVDATPLTEITTTFADLGIAAPLVNALSKQGIMHPFPIQIATLPDALAGHDILGRGQTGSGKTLAFGLALLNNLNGKVAKPHKPLALVLTPTRELAQQIDEVLMPLVRSIGHE